MPTFRPTALASFRVTSEKTNTGTVNLKACIQFNGVKCQWMSRGRVWSQFDSSYLLFRVANRQPGIYLQPNVPVEELPI